LLTLINSVNLINYILSTFLTYLLITSWRWRPVLKCMKSLCDRSWSVLTFYFILWVLYRVSNAGSNVSLMKEDCDIMFEWFKQKGYHHSRADGVFYILLSRGCIHATARRVAAIQRLTVATTAPTTVDGNPVNLRDFLKNFHFIPSRFADTLRQTKSTTFTVVYEYVCVYRRDEAARSARKEKKPHTWLAHSPLLQYPLYHNHSRQTLRLNIKLYCRGQGDERDGISISTWGAEKFNVAYNRHHSRSYILYRYLCERTPKTFRTTSMNGQWS